MRQISLAVAMVTSSGVRLESVTGLWWQGSYVLTMKVNIKDTGLDKNQIFQRKILNINLLISLTYVSGAQKNRLIEKVLLSTQNICFG